MLILRCRQSDFAVLVTALVPMKLASSNLLPALMTPPVVNLEVRIFGEIFKNSELR
jgi:hypothetical protein